MLNRAFTKSSKNEVFSFGSDEFALNGALCEAILRDAGLGSSVAETWETGSIVVADAGIAFRVVMLMFVVAPEPLEIALNLASSAGAI